MQKAFLPVRSVGDKLMVEIDGAPHRDLSLSLGARGLLVLTQIFNEVEWGGLPTTFTQKLTGATQQELDSFYQELADRNLLPWSEES